MKGTPTTSPWTNCPQPRTSCPQLGHPVQPFGQIVRAYINGVYNGVIERIRERLYFRQKVQDFLSVALVSQRVGRTKYPENPPKAVCWVSRGSRVPTSGCTHPRGHRSSWSRGRMTFTPEINFPRIQSIATKVAEFYVWVVLTCAGGPGVVLPVSQMVLGHSQ